MQSETSDLSSMVTPMGKSAENALKAKEWELRMLQEEVAAGQGIRIQRRPPTGLPLHYEGPFEFHLQNEGNTPRNILEEIIWYKDIEVSQVILFRIALECWYPFFGIIIRSLMVRNHCDLV